MSLRRLPCMALRVEGDVAQESCGEVSGMVTLWVGAKFGRPCSSGPVALRTVWVRPFAVTISGICQQLDSCRIVMPNSGRRGTAAAFLVRQLRLLFAHESSP